MSVINILSPHVADLIAAGEVVERPASVIKELLENAFDAGAKNVVCEIRNGGMTYIRVTDDGCGMTPEDAGIAFTRHATSKLTGEAGLERISTMGFRGEALAAISSVSHVELLTRQKGAREGTRVLLDGGDIQDMSACGCPDGTTMIIRNLFYNTPARLKFMKTDRSEASACITAAQRCALGRPDISLRMVRDGNDEFFSPGDGKIDSCLYALLGRDETASMLRCNSSSDGFTVKGFISSPAECRGNRARQFFFVNSRFIKSPLLQTALEQAYRNTLLTGRYPACALYLEIPYGTVDVNVHPAKTEVRFGSEKTIFDFVFQAVKFALEEENRLVSAAGVQTATAIRGNASGGLNGKQAFTDASGSVSGTQPVAESSCAGPADSPVLSNSINSVPAENIAPAKIAAAAENAAAAEFAVSEISGMTGNSAALSAPTGAAHAPSAASSVPSETASVPSAAASACGEWESCFSAPAVSYIPARASQMTLDLSQTVPAHFSDAPQDPQPDFLPDETASERSGSLSDGLPRPPTAAPGSCSGQSGTPRSFVQILQSDYEEVSKSFLPTVSNKNVENCVENVENSSGALYRIIGEAFRTYIIVEQNGEMILIDKHAAHERMIFDRLRKKSGELLSQMLLIPETVRLSYEDCELLEQNMELLAGLGFEIDRFGEKTWIVRGVPADLVPGDAAAAVEEICDRLRSGSAPDPSSVRDEILHTVACKAAIKAGWDTQPQELEKLVAAVCSGEIKYCPHGRPVSVTMTRSDLDRLFKRIV